MTIDLKDTPGRCRWCRCTDASGCEEGCAWANRQHTLCSSCVAIDRLVRSVAGRQRLVVVWKDARQELEG